MDEPGHRCPPGGVGQTWWDGGGRVCTSSAPASCSSGSGEATTRFPEPSRLPPPCGRRARTGLHPDAVDGDGVDHGPLASPAPFASRPSDWGPWHCRRSDSTPTARCRSVGHRSGGLAADWAQAPGQLWVRPSSWVTSTTSPAPGCSSNFAPWPPGDEVDVGLADGDHRPFRRQHRVLTRSHSSRRTGSVRAARVECPPTGDLLRGVSTTRRAACRPTWWRTPPWWPPSPRTPTRGCCDPVQRSRLILPAAWGAMRTSHAFRRSFDAHSTFDAFDLRSFAAGLP